VPKKKYVPDSEELFWEMTELMRRVRCGEDVSTLRAEREGEPIEIDMPEVPKEISLAHRVALSYGGRILKKSDFVTTEAGDANEEVG
jgi:hypothetical protein